MTNNLKIPDQNEKVGNDVELNLIKPSKTLLDEDISTIFATATRTLPKWPVQGPKRRPPQKGPPPPFRVKIEPTRRPFPKQPINRKPRPPQGLSPQGRPQQSYIPQGLPPQGLPPQGLPPQGLPPQGLPPQGLPPKIPAQNFRPKPTSNNNIRTPPLVFPKDETPEREVLYSGQAFDVKPTRQPITPKRPNVFDITVNAAQNFGGKRKENKPILMQNQGMLSGNLFVS